MPIYNNITNQNLFKPSLLSPDFCLQMALFLQKLGLYSKPPSKLDNHYQNYNPLSTSLHNFRYEISTFLSQILLKTGKESEPISLTWLQNCFKLIDIANSAFFKLVVEIDYPMSRWGGKATDEYLSYSLNLLDLLNSVTSSISHLNQAKMTVSHAVSLMKKSPTFSTSAAYKFMTKIPKINLGKDFKARSSTGIEERPVSDKKERVILQALMMLKKIGFLSLGFVLSGLCSDVKHYLEIRNFFPGGFDDPLIKVVDLRLRKEIMEIQGEVEEVREVNRVSAAIFAGRSDEAVGELKGRLEVLEESIRWIEKEVNKLFYEVVATRNKLLDNMRNI